MGQAVTGGTNYRPDLPNAEYVLYMGAFPGHSGKPMQSIGRQATRSIKEGRLKVDIIDPVMMGGIANPALDSVRWIPIKPTTDGAFGMGVIRWIIENERYNEEFLTCPNLESAQKLGYNNWTNAAQLVIIDENHPNYRKMLRAEDLGIEVSEDETDVFIVIDESSKEPTIYTDSNKADIYFEGKVKDKDGKEIQVKTSFLFLKESAFKYSYEEYSKECGIPVKVMEEVGKEFTSHGTKVATDGMGSTATANGANITSILGVLGGLVGSANKKGGYVTRRNTYGGANNGSRYHLATIPNAPKVSGFRVSRTGLRYENTSEYKRKVEAGKNPYPSTMPWHPVGSASDNQAIFSIINQYPYQTKIMFNWMASPLLAVPTAARKEVIDALKDPEVLPLIVCCDCYMGEVAAISDYIIPDTTPYESWGLANNEGNFAAKATTVRWPAVEPATEKLPDGRHISFETYVIDVAKKIGLPGFGENAITDKDGNFYPLNSREDFFIRGLANIAFADTPVADISKEELDNQDLENMFKEWEDILTKEEWPKALNVVSRGGRFENEEDGFDGDNNIYGFKASINFYMEGLATGRNSLTGEYYSGIAGWNPESFQDGTPIEEIFPASEWPFKSANYKPKFRSVSLLANSSTLRDINKHNYVEINSEDGKSLGIKTNDRVRVIPATGGEFEGIALVRPGIAKGTIGIAFGYGHWEYGAKSHSVDGKAVEGNEDIGAGVHLMSLTDPTVDKFFGISEASTGGPGRNGGAYKIVKI